jgi:membrane-associated phospholipid phosphatase
MWSSERLTIAYFAYLALVCWLRPIAMRRRLALGAIAASMILLALQIAAHAPLVVRQWAPAAYILIGYYSSALVFVAPSPALESWLMAWDRRLLGEPATRFAAWPRPLLALLEFAYMGCFLVVGAGYLALTASGHASLADRYWTLVVGAELGSFAPLAIVQTRPPWAVERKPVLADRRVHDLASEMTQRFTIRVNTFPSGHVAGSLAVALAVAPVMPWAGAVFLALALWIALATVVGRYHYIVDAIAGALLTLALWAVMVSFGFPHE